MERKPRSVRIECGDMVGDVPWSYIMKMEDRDLARHLAVQSSPEENMRRVDDEEKLGYFLIHDTLKVNPKGIIFRNSKVTEYIVYDKATGKVRISGSSTRVFAMLVREYFYFPNIFLEMPIKATPTLCKKIIEGTISTLRDFLMYVRSYVVRNKRLDLRVVDKFAVAGKLKYLPFVEDPENYQIDSCLPFPRLTYEVGLSFKIEEVGEYEKRCGSWVAMQSLKVGELLGRRPWEISNGDGGGVISRGEDVSDMVLSEAEAF